MVGISEGKIGRTFHFEAESTPNNAILIRIVEYGMLDAFRGIHVEEDSVGQKEYVMKMPGLAILYLRAPAGIEDTMTLRVEMSIQNGMHEVHFLKMQEMSLERLLDNNLLCLLPFYVFHREKDLAAVRSDPAKRKEFLGQYEAIARAYNRGAETGEITVDEKRLLAAATNTVVSTVAANEKDVVKGVQDMMYGDVLLYRPEDIKAAGKREGKREGETKGETKGSALTAIRMGMNMRLSDEAIEENIAQMAGISSEMAHAAFVGYKKDGKKGMEKALFPEAEEEEQAARTSA